MWLWCEKTGDNEGSFRTLVNYIEEVKKRVKSSIKIDQIQQT